MAVIWKAELTAEMVQDLNDDELADLVFALDEAVMIVASDFGVE